MGYRKYASKGEELEECKHYIINQILGIDGEPRTAVSMAKEFGCHESYMRKKIRAWRNQGLIGQIRFTPLEDDKDIIIELYDNGRGLSMRELAEKWEVNASSIFEALDRWGVRVGKRLEHSTPDRMPLNELKTAWSTLERPVIITVGRIPKFYLVPLDRG